MIKQSLKIFSQNIRKNKVLTNIILENNKNSTDIVFIQELPRSLIRRVPSHTNPAGDPTFGIPNHSKWTLFIRPDLSQDNYPYVATYVNKRLSKLRFTLCLNIVNHRDINVLAFHSDHNTNFIINIYSDSNQTTLQYLRQNIINLEGTIILTDDLNIRDSDWDPNFWHHSTYTEDLLTIIDSLGLELSLPLNPGPTRYADNTWDSNSVIDLVFLSPDNRGFRQHMLYPDICKPSDHVPLTIEVGIVETNTDLSFRSISKNSKKEEKFLVALISSFSNINSSTITTKEELEGVV